MRTHQKFSAGHIWIVCNTVLLTLDCTQGGSSSNDLDYFAFASNKMISTRQVTILSSFKGTLPQCARACREYPRHNLTGTGIEARNVTKKRTQICRAFEFVENASFCLLFEALKDNESGFGSLCPASGTTYFEMANSNPILSLFVRTPKQVLSEDTAYYTLMNMTSAFDCARNCLHSPGLQCKSFAYSLSKKFCAFSKYTNGTKHTLKKAPNYDFYQYRKSWLCNVTIGWKYDPKIIVSEEYPFNTDKPYNCFFNIIPPKKKHVVIKIMALWVLHSLCTELDAGIFVYGGQNGTSRVCTGVSVRPIEFRTENGRNITLVISQRKVPFVTRIHYQFADVDPCKEMKCQHGGICTIMDDSPICSCPKGFIGRLCEIDIGSCSSSPCLFGGLCASNETGYQCHCLQGTTGTNCEKFIGECYTAPCKHGNCSPTVTSVGYHCSCAPGYTGSTCEYEINECFSSPCVNGECKDLIDGYKCLCRHDFEGVNCDIESGKYECTQRNCKFGTCALNVSGSYCQCFPGFSGRNCDLDINECESSPCVHGTCNDHVNAYVCKCRLGYMGKRCNVLLDNPCKFNPCKNGYCSIDNGGYICICYERFHGNLCDKVLVSTTPSNITSIFTNAQFLAISPSTRLIHTITTSISLKPEKTTVANRRPASTNETTTLTTASVTKSILLSNTYSSILSINRDSPDITSVTNSSVLSYKATSSVPLFNTGSTVISSNKICGLSSPCQYNSVCINVGNTFQCVCKNQFIGSPCDFDKSTKLPSFQNSSVTKSSQIHTTIDLNSHPVETTIDYNGFTTVNVIVATNNETNKSNYKVFETTEAGTKNAINNTIKKVIETNESGADLDNRNNKVNATESSSSTTGGTHYSGSARPENPTGIWSGSTEKVLSLQSMNTYQTTTKSVLDIDNSHNKNSLPESGLTRSPEYSESTNTAKPSGILNGSKEHVAKIVTYKTYRATQNDFKTSTIATGQLERISENTPSITTNNTPIQITPTLNESIAAKRYHATGEPVKNNSFVTTKLGELSRQTLAPVRPTTGQKPLDRTSNHVITLESALIGGLAVALIAVICFAILLCYKQNRSGTVYISSALDGAKTKGTLDNTAVKKRFSSQDIYVEQMKERQQNPYNPLVNLPNKEAIASRKTDSSAPHSSSESSRSSSWNSYELVDPKSHVTLNDGNTVQISSTSDKSPEKINKRKPCGNLQTSQFTGNQQPNTRPGSYKHPSLQTEPFPFYQNEDGSYGLSLNQGRSVSPAAFQSVLDNLVASGKHKLVRPGTRRIVHQIDGAEFGKSEA